MISIENVIFIFLWLFFIKIPISIFPKKYSTGKDARQVKLVGSRVRVQQFFHYCLQRWFSVISTLKRIYCKRSFQHGIQSINQSLFSPTTDNCNHIYFKWMTLQKINFKMDFFSSFSLNLFILFLFFLTKLILNDSCICSCCCCCCPFHQFHQFQDQ